MKLPFVVLTATFALAGYVQAQHAAGTPEEKAVARACRADAEKTCAGKTGQEMQQCLKSNSEKLSADCKNAMSKLPAK